MTHKKTLWIGLAIVYAVVGAPNTTAIKVAVEAADPLYWVLARFLPLALVLTPFVLAAWKKLRVGNAWLYAIGGGLSMVTAIILYTLAVQYSQASYVSIVTLATPIILVMLSWLILRTSMNRQAMAGLTMAAIGAMVLVVLPIALSGGSVEVYPLATVLALGNSVAFGLAIIFMKRLNETSKVSLPALIGINSYIAVAVCGVLFYLFGDVSRTPNTLEFWSLALYSGFGVALIGRIIMIKVFEVLGPAFNAGIVYFETFLAILVPVVLIGEKISITMVIGGIFILMGLYLIEHHKIPHAKHHFVWRHH
jgi:drug/metabolite transporter (DMT)-like permease